jgi:hypothetical protein
MKVKDMPENEKYTTLDLEGKLFQNIIKKRNISKRSFSTFTHAYTE